MKLAGGVGGEREQRRTNGGRIAKQSRATERAADAAKSIFPREEVNDVDIEGNVSAASRRTAPSFYRIFLHLALFVYFLIVPEYSRWFAINKLGRV